jgi:hypothetical protein
MIHMFITSRDRLGQTAACCILAALPVWPASAKDDAPVPDFSGMWGRNSFGLESVSDGARPLINLKRLANGTGDGGALVGDYNNPILKPEAAQIVRDRGLVSLGGHPFPDPSNHCAPYSPPYVFSLQLGMQMVQGKDEILILYNQDDQVRHIHLGAAHPSRLVPSAMGDSIGHYEGDTLVVDTIGVKVGPLTMADRFGAPQSKALHLIERYRLIDYADAKEAQDRYEKQEGRIGGAVGAMPLDPVPGKGLQLQFTVEDPNVFTTKWTAQVTYHRTRLGWEEQVCAEAFHEYYADKDTEIPQARKPDF